MAFFFFSHSARYMLAMRAGLSLCLLFSALSASGGQFWRQEKQAEGVLPAQ